MSAYKRRIDGMVRRSSGGGNVALHGGPGAGKSYTASVLADTLWSQHGVRCVKFDLSTMTSGAQVFGSLANSLGADIGRSMNLHDAWVSLRATGEEAAHNRVVVLDEFDSVVNFPDSDLFLRHLRELVDNPARSRICAIVASRRNIRVLEESVRGISTLEGVFTPYYMSTLSKEDIEEGWTLGTLPASAWTRLLDWSGGVPRLVELYLSLKIVGTTDFPDAELARHEWIERQLDYLDTVGLRDAAAQYVLGPVVKRDPAARARLLAMRVIGDEDDGAGPLLATFQVFVSSLRARHEQSMDAWGPLGAAEAAARRLVRAVLDFAGADSIGDDGLKEKCPPEVRRVLHSGRSSLGARGIVEPSLGSVVAAFGRGDHWRVVDALWGRVGSSMSPPDRDYWRLRLSGLGGVGWSPGQYWEVDAFELGQWAEEIAAGHGLIERRPAQIPVNKGWSAGDINVTAVKGSNVGIGQHVINTTKEKRGATRIDIPRSGWGHRLTTVIGATAGLAGIISLIYYIIDR